MQVIGEYGLTCLRILIIFPNLFECFRLLLAFALQTKMNFDTCQMPTYILYSSAAGRSDTMIY